MARLRNPDHNTSLHRKCVGAYSKIEAMIGTVPVQYLYLANKTVLRIRVGSGFNRVRGSGFGIRIQIQGQEK